MAVLKLTCLVVRIWVKIKTMALQKVPDRATYCPEYPDKQEKREKRKAAFMAIRDSES